MAKTTPHELIGQLVHGDESAKSKLVRMGRPAVEPLLDALTGGHGKLRGAGDQIFDALKRLARKDVGAFVDIAKGHPAHGLVLFLIGHGSEVKGKAVPKAKKALKAHAKHRDRVLRHIAAHHLGDGGPKKKASKKASKKRAT